MYYIGIDIAKRAHEVCFTDEAGNVLVGNSFNIPNTVSGIDKLQKKLDKFEITADNAIVGMEATGHYWLVLYSYLVEQGFEVKVINPLVTDAYRNMLIRKVKNDRIDAQVVAAVLRLGEYQETSIADDETLALRQLCRFRLWQVDSCSDLKRKVIALLDQIFPEYEQLFSDVFGMSSRELLKTYTTPEEIAAIHTTKLANILNKASKVIILLSHTSLPIRFSGQFTKKSNVVDKIPLSTKYFVLNHDSGSPAFGFTGANFFLSFLIAKTGRSNTMVTSLFIRSYVLKCFKLNRIFSSPVVYPTKNGIWFGFLVIRHILKKVSQRHLMEFFIRLSKRNCIL